VKNGSDASNLFGFYSVERITERIIDASYLDRKGPEMDEN
jgi:hypothetical protein